MTRTTSITRGIAYAFGMLLLLYLSQTIISFYALSALSGLTKTIHDHPLVVSNAALSADTSILKMQREMKEIVLFTEPADITPVIKQVDELEQATFTQLRIIADNILGDEGQRLAAKTRQLFADWKPIRDEVIGLVRQGDRQAAARLTRNQGADHVAGLEMKMLELAGYARKKAAGLYSESRTVHGTIVNLTTAFFLTWLVLFALIVSGTLRRARASERAIHEEREKLRITLRSIGDGVIATDKNGDLTIINQVAEQLTGWKEAEAIGQHIGKVFRIINETTREECSNPVEKVLLSNTIVGLANHTVLLAKDGTERAIADSGSPIADQHGRVSGVVLVFRDQTEEREYQKKLERSEALLKEMGSIAKIGGWEFDPASGKGSWTEEVAKIHDLDPGDQTSVERGLSFYHGESRNRIEKAIREAIDLGRAYDLELELVTATGDHKWVRTMGVPETQDGKVVKVRGSFQDITARRAAKERIEHLNLVLRTIRRINQLIIYEQDPGRLIHEGCRLLVENQGYDCALIILTDASQHIVSWDRAGNAANTEAFNSLLLQGQLPPCCNCQQTEQTGIIPVNSDSTLCQQCTLAESHAASQSLCATLRHEETVFGYLVATRTSVLSVDQEERSFFNDLALDLAYALNVFRMNKAHQESTEKSETLERQLLQAQKMESVGRLAGGVAHDYNNMLSVIIGFTELALEEIEPDSTLRNYLSEVLLAARRSSDITRQLLAFARKQTIAPTLLDLNQTVVSMLNMLHRLIGEDIDLVWIPGANLWPTKIDPAQVDQIMANLCVNARDAIVGTGKLTIETKNVQLSEDYCADHAGFYPGDYVMLAVSDDGTGMTRDTLDNIFEPFFTTKGVGQGTGLGMSTVYGIVKQNKGFINVYSELNNGTTVRLYFAKDTGTAAEIQVEAALQAQVGQGETILLVEDEESILRLGKRILDSLGYTVLEALSPAAARQIAENYPGNIELLITDVIMPEMNGRELAGRLKTTFPDLKVLYMSGYTANAIAHHGVLEEDVCFMQKPFSKVEMAAKVRQALAGPC